MAKSKTEPKAPAKKKPKAMAPAKKKPKAMASELPPKDATANQSLTADVNAVIERVNANLNINDIDSPLKPASGWAKMKAAGRRGIMLSFTNEEYDLLKDLADADHRKLASWCAYKLLLLAEL